MKLIHGYGLILFILFLMNLVASAEASWPEERKKIDYLLDAIKHSNATFIRNGTEHGAEEAVSHLRMKLENAQSSWFAPDQKDWTAMMFIEEVASKSFLSGKPYQIRLQNQKPIEAQKWLLQKLGEYNALQ